MNVIDPKTRARAVRAAQGLEPFDLLLTGGTLVDVATSELRPADIGIVGPMIASVHERGSRADAETIRNISGLYLAPGFIDMHVHIESSHMTPANYASVVVPQGTTTILCDPHELANVIGLDGVRYIIEASRGLPLRVLVSAPSSVPSTEGLETSGACFGGAEMREMMTSPEVIGVAEVMDMVGVLTASKRMVDVVAAGLDAGKLVEGHARGLKGQGIQAYLAAGIGADHELTSAEDFIEKLRAGLTIEIRGSHDYLLPDIVKAINALPHVSSQITICTDDVFPDNLVVNGGIVDVLRRLIKYGLDPVAAIRCATLNASYRLQRPDIGLLAAGRMADIVVLSDLQEMAVESVFSSGRLVAVGEPVSGPAIANRDVVCGTMKLEPLNRDDFAIRVPGIDQGRIKVRAIRGARFTEWSEVDVDVKGGCAVLPKGYNRVFIMNRHGRAGAEPQCAIIEDWGDITGAVGTSYSHDSHNLVVIGNDPDDMCEAANYLIGSGGGFVVVKNRKVISAVDLPIAGMLSELGPQELAQGFVDLKKAADTVMQWQPPYRVFKAIEGTSLACNAGPHLTDLGLTDGGTKEIFPIRSDQEPVKAAV